MIARLHLCAFVHFGRKKDPLMSRLDLNLQQLLDLLYGLPNEQ